MMMTPTNENNEKDNKDENTKVEDTEAEEALHRMRTQLGLYYPQVLSTIDYQFLNYDHHLNHDNAELTHRV